MPKMTIETQPESILPKTSLLSEEDYQLAKSARGVGLIYVIGFLDIAKTNGLSINEVFDMAMAEPGQEEHHESYQKARDFLIEHAVTFKISVSNIKESDSI